MKKVVYSIILLAVVALMYSCTPSPEKLATGTWKLDSVTVVNIDELVQSVVQMQMGPIEEQLNGLNEQIAKLDPKKEKVQIDALTESIKQLEGQKAQVNPETVKADMMKNYNDLIGNTTFSFNEDKTYESKSFDMVEKGTWSISEDGKTITTVAEDASETSMMVDELTANKMVVSSEMPAGDMTVKTKFVCSK